MHNRTLEDMVIDLAPVTVPAFQGEKGYWTDYKKVAADGLSELRVKPQIGGFALYGESSIEIDCYYSDPKYTVAAYGLVYGDRQFEEAISTHIATILGVGHLPPITYTEQGMQTQEFISMEVGRTWTEHFLTLSNHQILGLTQNPAIERISIGEFDWSRPGPGEA